MKGPSMHFENDPIGPHLKPYMVAMIAVFCPRRLLLFLLSLPR
jgi:hypothetical protein